MFWLNIIYPHNDCNLKGSGKELCEVPGIDFFGCWEHSVPSVNSFESFADVWDSAPVCYRVHHRSHNCVEIFTHIEAFPAEKDWPHILESALKHLVSKGAIASWCGAWDLTMAYPELDGSTLYAAYSAETGLIGNTSLRETNYRPITETELAPLQAYIDERVVYVKDRTSGGNLR